MRRHRVFVKLRQCVSNMPRYHLILIHWNHLVPVHSVYETEDMRQIGDISERTLCVFKK